VKKVVIIPVDFSIAASELTPTLKLKRKTVTDKYRHLIEEMYKGEE
jgi:long-chain acyl-CoA synthetase